MDDKAKRLQALEERKRKLEELKRQKEAGSSLSAASIPASLPIASASGAQSAAAIAAAAIAAAAPPSTMPVAPLISSSATIQAAAASSTGGPASAASLDPLISTLLAAPLLDTPEADEMSRQKRMKQLAAIQGVVQVGMPARSGSIRDGGSAEEGLERLRCETGIQTEADEDAAAARLISAAASADDDGALAAAAARGRVLDDGSAANIFRQPDFGSFLSSAAGRLEAAMAAPTGTAAAAAGHGDGSTSLQRLFRSSADSGAAAGSAGRDEGASGFSPAVVALDPSAAAAANAPAHASPAPAVAAPGAAALAEAHGGSPASTACSAAALSALRGCPVTDLAWSAAAPGTLAVAYGASQGRGGALDFAAAISSGAGGGAGFAASEPPAVLIWSMQRPDAPLAALSLGSGGFGIDGGAGAMSSGFSGSGGGSGSAVCLGGDVTALRFHPHSPHLLLAGTSTGQVLAWDLRAPQAVPVAASGFAADAHLGPIAALMVTGSAAGSSLLSLSGDGRACVWGSGATGLGSGEPLSSSRLTQSVTTAGKDVSGSTSGSGSGSGSGVGSGTPGVGAPGSGAAAATGAQREAAASCAAFSAADPARLFVGGQEGALYTCQFSGAGVAVQGRVPAHYACVSAVSAHPSRDVPLLLSASFDGTIKLWNTEVRGR